MTPQLADVLTDHQCLLSTERLEELTAELAAILTELFPDWEDGPTDVLGEEMVDLIYAVFGGR